MKSFGSQQLKKSRNNYLFNWAILKDEKSNYPNAIGICVCGQWKRTTVFGAGYWFSN